MNMKVNIRTSLKKSVPLNPVLFNRVETFSYATNCGGIIDITSKVTCKVFSLFMKHEVYLDHDDGHSTTRIRFDFHTLRVRESKLRAYLDSHYYKRFID